MGKTTEFPTIADWLRQLDAYPNATVFGTTRKYTARDLATELRALLAERAVLQKECNDRAECEQSLARWNEELAADRDAWQEKAEDAERRLDDEKALRFEAQRPAARRFREVFGVRYIPKDPLPWVLHDTHRFRTLSGLIDSAEGSAAGLSDNSHKFLLSLESEPYEKVEDRLRDVIGKQLDYIGNSSILKLVDAIRAEFPHIDEPQEPDLEQTLRAWLAQQPAPTLTAAQHVAALVGMGAERRLYYDVHDDGDVPARCLVLPPEATP
jgi:hypothetical protein